MDTLHYFSKHVYECRKIDIEILDAETFHTIKLLGKLTCGKVKIGISTVSLYGSCLNIFSAPAVKHDKPLIMSAPFQNHSFRMKTSNIIKNKHQEPDALQVKFHDDSYVRKYDSKIDEPY